MAIESRLDGEKKAGFLTLFVFLVSRDCCVTWLFLTMAQACLQSVIVIFPDHTHLLFYMIKRCYPNHCQVIVFLRWLE